MQSGTLWHDLYVSSPAGMACAHTIVCIHGWKSCDLARNVAPAGHSADVGRTNARRCFQGIYQVNKCCFLITDFNQYQSKHIYHIDVAVRHPSRLCQHWQVNTSYLSLSRSQWKKSISPSKRNIRSRYFVHSSRILFSNTETKINSILSVIVIL